MLRLFGFFFPNLGILIQDSGAADHRRLIFQIFEHKSRRFQTNLTLSLILRFNLRLEATPYGVCI
jgi:hypothetical protein